MRKENSKPQIIIQKHFTRWNGPCVILKNKDYVLNLSENEQYFGFYNTICILAEKRNSVYLKLLYK